MKKNYVKNSVLAAMFIAIGIVLPFFTGQVPRLGNMLLPMHLPVFICSFICGWKYSLFVGGLLPLLRSFIFGMPMLYPTAIAMSVELAVYGLVTGLVYGLTKKNTVALYISMLTAMISGRVAWGIAQVILLGLTDGAFTWQMFIAGAFLNAIPGIILQLIIVPVIVTRLKSAELA